MTIVIILLALILGAILFPGLPWYALIGVAVLIWAGINLLILVLGALLILVLHAVEYHSDLLRLLTVSAIGIGIWLFGSDKVIAIAALIAGIAFLSALAEIGQEWLKERKSGTKKSPDRV